MGGFFITQASLRNLKQRVANELPLFPSAHLSEALASSFGERTYASLRSRFTSGSSIEVPEPSTLEFTRRARELGQGAHLRGWRGLSALPHGRQGSRPYRGERALAWRNILVATINAGIEQGVFGLEPDQNFWPGAKNSTHGRGQEGQFDFELAPDYPAAAVVSDIGYGELALYVAIRPKDRRFIACSNGGRAAGEAHAVGWFERALGVWLQASERQLTASREVTAVASKLTVRARGFGDRGKVLF